MKKNILFTLFIVCFVKIAVAQQRKIDSLTSVLRMQLHDTARVNTLIGLSTEYTDRTPDTALALANEALALSKKINYPEGTAAAYNRQSRYYESKGQYGKGKELSGQALVIYTTLKHNAGIAETYGHLGAIYIDEANLDSALTCLLKALEIREAMGDKNLIARSYSNLAGVLAHMGEYPRALDYLLKGLRIAEGLDNNMNLALLYHNIGAIYKRMYDYRAAITYYKKAEAFTKKTNDKRGLAITYDNLGNCYGMTGDWNKALEYISNSLQMHKESGDSAGTGLSYDNLGHAYDSLNNSEKALECYLMAKSILEKTGNKIKLITVYSDLGSAYTTRGDYNRAIEMHLKALVIAQEVKDPELISSTSSKLSLAYEKKGNLSLALSYYKLYSETKDSLLSSDKIKQVTELQTKYETEKKDHEIALLNKDNLLHVSEIEKQKAIRNSVIGGVGLAGIFTFFLITSYNRRKKVSMDKRMAEVEMKALRAQMNPHFIFNALNSIVGFMRKNEMAAAEDYLGKFSKLIRMTLENSRQQEVSLADDLHALQLYMDLEALRLGNKFNYIIDVAKDIKREAVYIPPLLLQPFVENSILHGISHKEGNGTIFIRIHKDGELLRCEVEDNGVGRTATAKPAGKKESLGIAITNERLDIINHQSKSKASVLITDLEQGVRVLLTLPYFAEA